MIIPVLYGRSSESTEKSADLRQMSASALRSPCVRGFGLLEFKAKPGPWKAFQGVLLGPLKLDLDTYTSTGPRRQSLGQRLLGCSPPKEFSCRAELLAAQIYLLFGR